MRLFSALHSLVDLRNMQALCSRYAQAWPLLLSVAVHGVLILGLVQVLPNKRWHENLPPKLTVSLLRESAPTNAGTAVTNGRAHVGRQHVASRDNSAQHAASPSVVQTARLVALTLPSAEVTDSGSSLAGHPAAHTDGIAAQTVASPLANQLVNASETQSGSEAAEFTAASYQQIADPEYPMMARRMGLEGVVVLAVRVSRNGRPLSIRVEKSSRVTMLDDAAISAVRTWRFTPAYRGSVAVEDAIRVPVEFRLGSAG